MDLRPATEADRDAVLSLALVEEDAWFGEAEHSAGEVAEWIEDEGGIKLGVVALDGDGRIRGFASAGRRSAVFLADPADTDPVTDVLVPWLQEQSGTVELMTYGADAIRVRAFERHGLRPLRSSFTLARPASAGPVPEPVFPSDVAVAPYRLGEDDEAVHRLIYVDAAFGSVRGHVERDIDAWLETMRPCRSLFLARRDGRPIGWVAGRGLDSGRGEIATLAVAASERGRGIGRALLLHAFRDLQIAGHLDLTLGVEGENEAALGLYRSVGLEVEREWRIYAAR